MEGAKREKTTASIASIKDEIIFFRPNAAVDLPLPAGRLSDVQICLHEPKAHMQTYLYGTAKETKQMPPPALQKTAPKKQVKYFTQRHEN